MRALTLRSSNEVEARGAGATAMYGLYRYVPL